MRKLLVTLILALLLTACGSKRVPQTDKGPENDDAGPQSSDPKELIVGTWKFADEVYQFRANGNFFYNKSPQGTVNSTYQFLNNDTLELNTQTRTNYIYYGPGAARTDLPSSITSNNRREAKVKVSRSVMELDGKTWKRVSAAALDVPAASATAYLDDLIGNQIAQLEATTKENRFQQSKAVTEAARILTDIGPRARAAVPALIGALRVYSEGVSDEFSNRLVGALGAIGPDAQAAIPEIIPRLGKESSRWAATEALRKIGPVSLPAVRDALKAPSKPLAKGAALALGQLGPAAKEAIPDLAAALQDKELRPAAAEALARIGAPEARPAVPELVRQLKDYNREEIIVLLGNLGPAAEEAIPVLVERLDNIRYRTRAAEALLAIDPKNPQALASLRARLKEGLAVDEAAVLFKVDPMDKQALGVLLQGLEAKDPEVRCETLRRLYAMGPKAKAAWQAVTDRYRRDENYTVRQCAAGALRTMDAAASLPLLMQGLEDPHPLVRSNAAVNLSQLGPAAKAAVPALIKCLADNDANQGGSVRQWAAQALGEIGPEAREAVPHLTPLLKDQFDFCRLAVALALEKIQGNP